MIPGFSLDKIVMAVISLLYQACVFLFNNYSKIFFLLMLISFIFLCFWGYRTISKMDLESLGFPKKTIPRSSNEFTQEHEDKIAGLDDQIEEIYKQITLPRSISPELRKKLRQKQVKGIVFYGPPGTGKTMLARNLANKLGCTSISKISAVSLLDKYYGSSEQKLREVFERNPGVSKDALHMVILDEIDSICPQRKSGSTDSNFFNGMTNQLLSLMDGLDSDPNVLVVGTTNNLDFIDPAILRPGRFDLHIKVDLPNQTSRESIIKVYTEELINSDLMEPFNTTNVAENTNGYSGADLESMVRNATTKALYRHVKDGEPFYIKENDLVESLTRSRKY